MLGELEAKLWRFNKDNSTRVGEPKDLSVASFVQPSAKRDTLLSSMIEQASALERTDQESDLECNSLVTIGEILYEPKSPLEKAIRASQLEDSGHSEYSKKMKQKNLKRIKAELETAELDGPPRDDRVARPSGQPRMPPAQPRLPLEASSPRHQLENSSQHDQDSVLLESPDEEEPALQLERQLRDLVLLELAALTR